MRNKGLVLFFTILIALTCLYCLSFSFVTWKIEKDAKAYANDNAAQTEVNNAIARAQQADTTGNLSEMHKKLITDEVLNNREREYLAKKNDEKVYLGFTYKECKYKELNLGLDLKGGMNVTLAIASQDIVKELCVMEDSLYTSSYAAAIKEYNNGANGTDFIDVFAENFNKNKKGMNATLATYFGDRVGKPNGTDAEIVQGMKGKRDEVLDQTFQILRTRIDKFGVAQPNLEKLQGGRILVELPGVKEKERVEDLLKSTAQLEFWTVYVNYQSGNNFFPSQFRQAAQTAMAGASSADSTNLAKMLTLGGGQNDGLAVGYYQLADTALVGQCLPAIKNVLNNPDLVFYWGIADRESKLIPLVPLIKNSPEVGPVLCNKTVDGARIIRSASQNVDEVNRVIVNMSMEDEAAKEWQRITKNAMSQGHPVNIAIVLDEIVYSYPHIQNEIANGNSQISGNFTVQEAKDLATVLNSGNLEVGLDIIASEVVGPTLGQRSINAGFFSFLIAFILVLLYMFIYYDRAGLVADLALLCNVFFIIGVLASLQAVLTLPGMAGIVLTLGMAVDANVLIYERIREEIRNGKGQRLAVDEGYKNAYSAIIDGNVTTLITGIVLYILGSGPIQGFATTLIIGILSSLFSAIFISRMVFDTRLNKGKELKFGNRVTMNAFSKVNFDFLKTKKTFYIVSGTLICISIISFFTLKLQPGIDFTGGRNYVILFDQDVDASAAADAVTAEFGGTPQVKTFGNDNQLRVTVNYKINDNSQEAEADCYNKLYKALKGFYKVTPSQKTFQEPNVGEEGIQSYQKIQATVAHELLGKAIISVLVALVLIFIYIAFRFRNWQFGLGAVMTLAHDTILTIGLFSLFWKISPFSMEIDQQFIAAILTVIGYSINNVVIIYDRVRENLTNSPKGDRYNLFNASINSTLGRNFNTCGTTLLVLIVIFIFGGEVIRGFVFAMLAGIAIGTYSGMFIAPGLAFDLLKRKKEVKVNVAKLSVK